MEGRGLGSADCEGGAGFEVTSWRGCHKGGTEQERAGCEDIGAMHGAVVAVAAVERE